MKEHPSTAPNTEPIVPNSIEDAHSSNGRQQYQIAHADGTVCSPSGYEHTPALPVPCNVCGDSKKAERLHLSNGAKDPSKSVCKKCFFGHL